MACSIICVFGSPHANGNTGAMTALAMQEARRLGARVVEVAACELDAIKPGCIGCQQCQESTEYRCSQDDQLSELVAELPDDDVIVLATPIYWWSYPAQLKMVVDRMYALTKFTPQEEIMTPLAGKTLALLATGVGPLADNLDLLERQCRHSAELLGCAFRSCIFADTAPVANELINDPAAIARAEAFGRGLVIG